MHHELRLGGQEEEYGLKLIGFSDADWAQNRSDRKSNNGYTFIYNGGMISWACRKQTCTALSLTEAEYIAMTEASQEGVWLRKLLEDWRKRIRANRHIRRQPELLKNDC